MTDDPPFADFADFYSSSIEETLRSARRLAAGNDMADDATQDTYASMLRRWGELCGLGRGHLTAYARRAAINQVISQYRRNRVLEPLDGAEPVLDDGGLEEVLAKMTTFEAMRHLVASQPPARRTVVTLYFIEEFTYQEIAAQLAVAESTVRTHVERFRQRATTYLRQQQGGER